MVGVVVVQVKLGEDEGYRKEEKVSGELSRKKRKMRGKERERERERESYDIITVKKG